MKTRLKSSLLITALAVLPGAAFAQTLLLDYNFNNVVGASVTDASGNGRTGTLFGVASQGSATSGLTGAFDPSLDLTAATVGGTTANSGGGVRATDLSALSSFTVTMWINKETTAVSGTRLLDDGTSLIAFTEAGKITFNSTGTAVGNGTPNANLLSNDSWTFVAVSFDGTTATNNVKIYVGTTSVAATLIAQGNSALTGIDFGANLSFGARFITSDRGLDGSMDNIRLYGEAAGSGGVLDLAAINAVRIANLTAIPEPSAFAAFLAVGALGFATCKRRRRVATGAA